jgi:predicted Na+-dependent transporter
LTHAPCCSRLQVNIGDLFAKLAVTILAPSVLGKLLREYVKPVEEFAKKWRAELSMVGQWPALLPWLLQWCLQQWCHGQLT